MRRAPPLGHASARQRADASAQWCDELFSNAVNNLNRLEEFDASEVRNQILQRMRSVDSGGQLPQAQQADPLQATWPGPEMLEQIVNRLDQWVKVQNRPSDWKLDPLVATLPAAHWPSFRWFGSSTRWSSPPVRRIHAVGGGVAPRCLELGAG